MGSTAANFNAGTNYQASMGTGANPALGAGSNADLTGSYLGNNHGRGARNPNSARHTQSFR